MKRIGITMGCPVGIGPEIILKYLNSYRPHTDYLPVVIGDIGVLRSQALHFGVDLECSAWLPKDALPSKNIAVVTVSDLNPTTLTWGKPNGKTGSATAAYIQAGVRLATTGILDAIATCPISKYALHEAGFTYPGHTEMLADLTATKKFTMMMAGKKLRITLVTIHCSFVDIVDRLNVQAVFDEIHITNSGLISDFGLNSPKIAVAGLNPHSGEGGLFGKEEKAIIAPAIALAKNEGINAHGPYPPDTIFYQAVQGKYDAVVCMYHDQGLIPFKLIHFHDGVNVTLGLPIVRTSVDHGTGYDIAGQGIANCESLAAAIKTAAQICDNRHKRLQ